MAIGYALLVSVPHPVATVAVSAAILVPGPLMAAFAPVVAAWRAWVWLTGGYLLVCVVSLLALIALQETVASPLTFFILGPLIWVAMTRRAVELVVFSGVFLAVYVPVAVFGDAGPDGYWIANLGTILAVVVACSVRRVAMERDQMALRRLSRTDPLTGCLNRRGFEALLSRSIAVGDPFTLVAFDLDGLKLVNDTQGHGAGDELLCAAADGIVAAAGPEGVVGRLGGDEFAALIRGGDAGLACAVEGVSFGAASYPADGVTGEVLFARADYALYEAKRVAAREPLAVAVAASAPQLSPLPAFTDSAPAAPAPRGARGGLRLAALLHLAGFVTITAYALATIGHAGHWLIAVVGAAGGAAAAVAAVGADLLRRSSVWRITYTVVAFTTTFIALVLDGGPGDPLASGFILPVMAVAMTARPRDLVLLGGGLVLAFAGVIALTGFGPPGYTPIMLAVTALAAGACCAQQTEMVRQRRRLDRISSSDVLTGCLNRRGMREALSRMDASPGASIALLSIDLDGFKAINDNFGHAAGDDLLRWVGKSITSCVRKQDAVGRMGGDEFCVLIPAPFKSTATEIAALVEGVLRHRTEVSIGCAVYPDEVADLWSLKKLADDRMYDAKRAAALPR